MTSIINRIVPRINAIALMVSLCGFVLFNSLRRHWSFVASNL